MKSLFQLLLPVIGDSKPVLAEDDSMHHLSRVMGVWRMRVTVDMGPKLAGKRLVISLGTGNLAMAKRQRDLILKAYAAAGVKILTRAASRFGE